ncbi:MAG: glutamine--fructose-6-phosphate transaminase (isomerizing), partial [Gammaproteobacteria bacterium]
MCGIVGAIARFNIVPHLLEGLRRLEYRGYDSAGIAVITRGRLERLRLPGKVQTLADALASAPLEGFIGIAHTRWATHGPPSEQNAHPHICCNEIAVVHNGIIENHEALRLAQSAAGYRFTSQTDTEVIAHQIHWHLRQGLDLLQAVRATTQELEGAFALGVISIHEPDRLIAARRGSPLVIGLAEGGNFIASDIAALLPLTRRFIHLEDGDLADITREGIAIYDDKGRPARRPEKLTDLAPDAVERGQYRHYMQKEIFEQPQAISETLEGRIARGKVLEAAFGPKAKSIFDQTRAVYIIACGTSYHAGLVARNWFEGLAGIPCRVEVASEFRYRHPVVDPDTLFVFISQSGETADTLAALRKVKAGDIAFTGPPPAKSPALAICNVPE